MGLTQTDYNKKLFPITVVLLVVLILIARLMWGYGNPHADVYSDAWETISGLGDWEESPVGFLFFQLWGLVIGVFILHVLPYIHQRLWEFKDELYTMNGRVYFKGKLTAKHEILFGDFLLFMGGIGFIIMGLIPADLVGGLHEISAGFGFGGVVFSSGFHLAVVQQAGDKMNQKIRKIITIMWWVFFIWAIAMYGVAEFYYKSLYDLGWYDVDWGEAGVPVIFSFSLAERIGFIMMVIYLGALGYILPKEVSTAKKE